MFTLTASVITPIKARIKFCSFVNFFIFSKIHSLDSLDFFINRSEVFSGVGRIHNFEQSKEIDKVIKKLAKENGINLIDVEQNDAVEKILEKILN